MSLLRPCSRLSHYSNRLSSPLSPRCLVLATMRTHQRAFSMSSGGIHQTERTQIRSGVDRSLWQERSMARHYGRPRRRDFSSTSPTLHGHLDPPKPGEEYDYRVSTDHAEKLTPIRRHVTFIDKEGDSHTFTVADGDNLLDIAQANDLEMEGSSLLASTSPGLS